MKIATYTHFGGVCAESAALSNILFALGVRNPLTQEPFTEALLFGLSGGLGAGYMLYETGGERHVILGFQHGWQKGLGEPMEVACTRLHLPIETRETGSPKAAEAELRMALSAGSPVYVTCAASSLPHRKGSKALAKIHGYGVVVVGIHQGIEPEALVDDRASVPLTLPLATLQAARTALGKGKNRTLIVKKGASQTVLRPVDVRMAVIAGLRDFCEEMLRPPIRNYGLSAWERFATLLTSTRDRKGWPQVFAGPEQVGPALTAIFRAIELDGGGGGLRPLFADFLSEAAELLPELSEEFRASALHYRALATDWTAFAEAALPDELPDAHRLKVLLRKEQANYKQVGLGDTAEAARQTDVAREIAVLTTSSFGLSVPLLADLRANLSQRMLRISKSESEGISKIKQILSKQTVKRDRPTSGADATG